MMILWWALIIAGVVFLVNTLTQQRSRKNRRHSALDVLKERYAKGEISKKDFEEKKRDIA